MKPPSLPTHTLTIGDIMKWLGITHFTLYCWMRWEEFPYKYIDKKRRFKKEEIEKWFDEQIRREKEK